jgi:preprotein translocase subunit SecE
MKVINYIKETRGELKHVSWPTKKQAFAFTAIVIVLSLLVAFYLGFFDFIFSKVLEIVV